MRSKKKECMQLPEYNHIKVLTIFVQREAFTRTKISIRSL